MKTLRLTISPLMLMMAILAASNTAIAQRSASELSLLQEESVREELGINGDSAEKLEAILKISKPDSDFYKPYFDRIAAAGKDAAAKAEIQKEMFAATAAKVAEMKAKALTMLSDSQKQQLRGIFLRSTGVRVFSDDRVAAEYGLSEEQIKQFGELASAYRTASRAIPDDATEDDRDKFATEWKQKFLAGLSAEQKARFEKESAYGQAPAMAVAGAAGSPGVEPNMNQPPEGQMAEGSFGGGAPGESQRVAEFRFNFRFESWERVLQMYADGAGLTLDLNQIPPGTFSHYDDNSYTARQTLDILNGYLHRKGYAMIENDGFLIVMNTDNGIPPYLIRDVSEEQLLKIGKELELGNNELGTLRISVDGMDTAKVAQEVEALLGPLGSLVALTESQLLIITDVGANLRRVHGFLATAMSKAKPDALMFVAYPLQNMDAEEAEIAVMTQFGMRQNVQNVSSAAEEQRRSQSRSQAMQRGGAPQPAPAAPSKTEAPIQIASDMRLNSLLVTGTAAQHELVTTILTALDVSEDAMGNSLERDRRGSYLEVYKVSSADAREVTKTLGAMNIPGVNVVNEDGNNGTIHIVATARQHEEVAALIRQLDGGGVSGSVAVIQLAQMDPLSAAATLRSLFYADGDNAPTIETDLYGRRLIIRGGVDQIAQIKQVLADLGEDGSGLRDRGDGGMVRRFSLQGRNPEQFLQVLQQQWESQQETKINIVVPNEASPIKSRRTPEEEFDRPAAEPTVIPEPQNSPLSKRSAPAASDKWNQWRQPSERTAVKELTPRARLTSAVQPANMDETTSSDATSGTEKKSWDPNSRDAGANVNSDVFIQLLGDDLILSATDESKLDELEDLLDFLHQSLPMKPEYTVVYLKAADALEAADMLSQFFPSSSVASTSLGSSSSMLGSLGGSLGGMGSSLLDMTGLSGLGATSSTLKIIPDIRTNSLFITGPQSLIKDALVFLKVLDSNDLPDSLKDMQPRQIIVKHADVNDVSNLLQSVFKPYMEAAGGGKQQQQNPLAAMFGGGGGGGRGAVADPASQVRMTLGVDAQTSILTINSSQEIFDEVESVVLQMDDAAKTARPTVLPIQLKNADATVIQQMLQGLMPRVSVSTSKTNSGRSDSGSSSGGGGSSSSGDADAAAKAQQAQQDAFRRAIEQRMQGGGAGGGGGTGGGGRTGARGGGGGRTGGGGRGR